MTRMVCAGLLACLATAAPAQAQPAARVEDINIGSGYGSDPSGFTTVGGITYFQASDDANGGELWRTDGTAAGTRLVRDIAPGPSGSGPHQLTDLDGTLFFSAAKGLWRSDGTAAGTTEVRRFEMGPDWLVVQDRWLYFAASDAAHGRELWRSDGTDAGTTLVKDIAPGPTNSGPSYLVAFEGLVFFVASGPQGSEIWRTDGTAAGTVIAWDVHPGPAGSGPYGLAVAGTLLYFAADDGVRGYEPWQFDALANVATLVKDVNPGVGGSYPEELTPAGGAMYFSAFDTAAGREVWRSDGTPPGTFRVRDILPGSSGSDPRGFTAIGDVVFFSANDGVNGFEVWRTDGTAAGTLLVLVASGPAPTPGPSGLTEHDGILYFALDDGTHGRELWRSDGTSAGTMLFDLRPGLRGSNPTEMTSTGSRLYFSATSADEQAQFHFGEPWTSDGTLAGTAVLKRIGSGASSQIGAVGRLGDRLLFGADEGVHGTELWVSDGTEAGTFLLKDLLPGEEEGSHPRDFTPLNGLVYFTAFGVDNTALWRTDGTPSGTVAVPGVNPALTSISGLTLVGGTIFFSGQDAAHGAELWKTDGTGAGTVLVRDINPGPAGSMPFALTALNGTLFFTAYDTVEGRELWRSDGTDVGTARVEAAFPGPGCGCPGRLTAANGLLYYYAFDEFHGAEPWRSDGTDPGTQMIRDVMPGPQGSYPDDFVAAKGITFFTAEDGSSGRELWRTEGWEASTMRVRDIRPGPSSSDPADLTRVGTSLLFGADDGVEGRELWRTDGTETGTTRVRDIFPGPTSSLIGGGPVWEWGGWAFFAADAPGLGQELWRSDGTEEGTTLLQDIAPGPPSSALWPLATAGGRFFMRVVDDVGQELWSLRPELTVADTVVDEGSPALVPVSLVPALDVPLAVPFATADGTAQATLDYVPRSGALTFAPGATTLTVDVTVLDDLADEPDEDFFLDLAGPTPAYLADGRARVVVRDDDPTLVFSVDDVAVTEGDVGDVTAAFTVRLSPPPPVAATVEYATVSGTAVHGVAGNPDDFTPVAGTLTFGPGVATQVVDVAVHGDPLDEPDELFLLQLRNPTASVVGDDEGVARILDDDGGTLSLLHLERDTDHVDDVTLQPGAPPNVDRYLLRSEPWSSYEVTIDAVSGDMSSPGPFSMGPHMVSETPVYGLFMNSEPIGTRFARAVRLDLAGDSPLYHYIVVGSNGCSTDCGPDDTYRIRVRETTGHIARFNNSGGQRTVLILQNSTNLTYGARVSFWAASGERLFSFSVSMAPHASAAIDTALAVPGATGSITVSHNGPYGGLAGKAVSFDPTTGFAFDTPMTTRPR